MLKGKAAQGDYLALRARKGCDVLHVPFQLGTEYLFFLGERQMMGLHPADERDPDYAERLAALTRAFYGADEAVIGALHYGRLRAQG
jgi:hypothetical protein